MSDEKYFFMSLDGDVEVLQEAMHRLDMHG
jgi:hypothetical protein